MTVKFIEPGGDADFALATTNGFWGFVVSGPTIATDFVHGNHLKSIKYTHTGSASYVGVSNVVANAGGRVSAWFYFNALPGATTTLMGIETSGDGTPIINVRMTSAGVIQLWNASTAQVGTNGSTLATGKWYRLSFAWTITSSTVNQIRLFKDGVIDVSVTNGTLSSNVSADFFIGNGSGDGTADIRTSDLYIDDSTALTDPGNIWVTAKRPNANGTTNGFTTQIGSGGSGYGTGHSPQVNERALSTTNGWSMVGAGSAITEEYNIEGSSVGDINIINSIIVDYMGWVSASSLAGETASIIVNNVTSNIALTSTNTLFKKIAGSTTYPAGAGKDIGIITTTALTTVSLYECGIVVAYIPLGDMMGMM